MGIASRIASLGLIALGPIACFAAQTPSTKTTNSQADFSTEAAVIQSYHTVVSFENGGTGTRDVEMQVRVQSQAGVQQYALLALGYSSSIEQLQIDYVRVRHSDGTMVSTPLSNVQDMPADITRQAPEYSDYREKHVAVEGLEPGSLLEYHLVYKEVASLIPGQFWLSYDFDKTDIVLDEELQLSVPQSRAVKMKSTDVQPAITEEGGRRVYVWKSKNLKRQDQPPHELGDFPPPAVQMSTFQSWADLGAWWMSLAKPQMAPTPEIRAKAAELTQGMATEDQKIRAIYSFVSRQFHYISISFGIGRYQPHPAGDVLKNAYGDCKDESTLLASLLNAAGIEAWPALVNATRTIDPDVPSPSQFDHVITVVNDGGQLLWMDTTTQVAPAGFLTFNLRNKQALLMPSGTPAHLAPTPPDPKNEYVTTFKVDGKLADDGTLTAKISTASDGDRGLITRLAFRNVAQSQWKDLAQSISYAENYGGTVSNVSASSPEDPDHPFSYSYDYTRKDYPDWKDHQIAVALPPAGFPSVSDDKDKLPQPIILGAPADMRFQAQIVLPKGYTPTIPDPVDLSEPYAEYHAKYSFKDGVLSAEREVVLKAREAPVAQREEYRTFQKAVAADELRYVVLSNGSETIQQAMANPEFRQAIQDATNQFRSGNYPTAEEAIKRALKVDPNSEIAWQTAGSIYTVLDDPDNAIAAVRKAISLAPKDYKAYDQLAYILARAGRQEEISQVWRDFVQKNPQDAVGHWALGGVYMQDKKYNDAISELDEAAKLDPKNASYQVTLGNAYAAEGIPDKANSAFERAVALDPSPQTWNSAGYYMADHKVNLPEAEHFVEMAVQAEESDASRVSLQNLQDKDLAIPGNLAAYWDSLGWVYFRKGDLEAARKYIAAAFDLSQYPEISQHLGQVEEKLGHKEAAIEDYAMALAPYAKIRGSGQKPSAPADPWVLDVRKRLAPLIGEERVDSEIEKMRDKPSDMRTYRVSKRGLGSGSADFFVLIGAGGKPADVKFIRGSNELRPAAKALDGIVYKDPIPDDSQAKIIRRGILTCNDLFPTCDFVLFTPDMVHSVQ